MPKIQTDGTKYGSARPDPTCPVAISLSEGGWAFSVVNPASITCFAQSELSRNKTEKADAKLLGNFAQRADLNMWQPPSAQNYRQYTVNLKI